MLRALLKGGPASSPPRQALSAIEPWVVRPRHSPAQPHTHTHTTHAQIKVDLNQPTEFVATETFTAAGREWPELKKEVKLNA